MGQSYATTASTIGTSLTLPAEGEKALTVHVLPVESKITQCLPTTIIFACESNSDLEPDSEILVVALAIKYASRAINGRNDGLPSRRSEGRDSQESCCLEAMDMTERASES